MPIKANTNVATELTKCPKCGSFSSIRNVRNIKGEILKQTCANPKCDWLWEKKEE